MIYLEQLPLLELIFIATGFGLIIGSFLNVYIYRFHTGRSLTGGSHCLSCGRHLRWFELFPVVSFLALRGKCRSCGCRIPPRYAVVESLTALLFVFSAIIATSYLVLLLLWVIMSLLVVIIIYDINHYIIPDRMVLLLTLGVLLFEGLLWWNGTPPKLLLGNVLAALLGSSFFLTLWFVSKGKWLGFGDVKLAFPLGLLVGANYVFSMIVFSFWIGTIISLTLISYTRWQRGKLSLRFVGRSLTMKSVVPFAPFLIAGCLLVFFTHINVIGIFSFT
jgi:prepilin signal peptidase PulO-like enzyme (type II secretory pathway)